MVKILQKEAPVLREIAKDIPIQDITSPRIQKIIRDMRKALASQDDGVAIAAPQIGEAVRIFVLSGRVPDIVRGDEPADSHSDLDAVFINPVLVKSSKERETVEEGCLSVRYLYGRVSRAKKATVKAYDETGKPFTRGGSGLVAQIFQHELDHLDGVLFIDKAEDVVSIPPEEQEELDKKSKNRLPSR